MITIITVLTVENIVVDSDNEPYRDPQSIIPVRKIHMQLG